MLTYIDSSQGDVLPRILKRAAQGLDDIGNPVREIMATVRREGDKALMDYTEKFDGVKLEGLEVDIHGEMPVIKDIDISLKSAIDLAIKNIDSFHRQQVMQSQIIETMPGVRCWRKAVAIEKVGLYIPGGSAPLFSTILMLAVPARIAGCKEVILCTPPDKKGQIHPAILYAARATGVHRLFRVGGAQAIAAMTYGTGSIPKVDKIFGPGNAWVTVAKQIAASSGMAIDLPAGPSELAILADESANPDFVAADLLSQAEHGADSQVLLLSNNEAIIHKVLKSLEVQLKTLPRQEIARKALKNSFAIHVKSLISGMDILNDYAPEHLIISCRDAEMLAEKVVNAGSVFLGNYSPESAGDYASGTNHALPTMSFAKSYSGVSLDSFVKKITFQQISEQGLKGLGNAIECMAEAEGLEAHKRAVSIRLNPEKFL